jgi:hypothetical protein
MIGTRVGIFSQRDAQSFFQMQSLDVFGITYKGFNFFWKFY